MGKDIAPPASDVDVDRFNRWAPTYDQSMMQRWFFGPVHAEIIKQLLRVGPQDPQCCIIDVGCGTGRLLRAIAPYWPQAQLFGVDPAKQMLAEAHRLNPKVNFVRAPAEFLPFPDQTADMVLSSISFHHWADQQRGIGEVARVLRPGGWFCLADHTFLPARWFGDKVRSDKDIYSLMNAAGLTVRQHQRMGIRFVLITLAQKPDFGK